VYILPEDGHRSGPKHVVVVHNKIEHEKYLLRTVVLIKVLDYIPLLICTTVYILIAGADKSVSAKLPALQFHHKT
jgi:hypothetical protein